MKATVLGHFGEWFQGLDPNAKGLVAVTVHCSKLCARAERLSYGRFEIEGGDGAISELRGQALFRELGLKAGRFRVVLTMPPGGGAGASTATLVALARAGGYEGDELAAACIAVEGATDPLMLDEPDAALWAPRRAEVVSILNPPPPVDIVGGFLGAPVRTDPDDLVFPVVSDLVDRWRLAGTAAAVAEIATEAALRTTKLRGPGTDPTAELTKSLGGLGWLRAHTGSARGIIFHPGGAPSDAEVRLASAGMARPFRFSTGRAR